MKAHIFYKFSEYENDGIGFTVIKPESFEIFKRLSEYNYLCDVDLPEVDREKLIAAGVSEIDKNIAELQMKINAQKERKNQLLAIEYKGAA